MEVRRARIGLLQGSQVFLRPPRIGKANVADSPIDIGPGWHREPLHTISRLDSIAIAPVVLRVLNIIVEYEDVDVVNDVEVSLPRNVVGLQYRGAHQATARKTGRDSSA